MNNNTLQKIELATRKSYPKEMCGFVLTNDEFIQLENIHNNPEIAFEIPIYEYHKYKDQIKYIIHSHTKNCYPFDVRTPSINDLMLYETYKIPLLICGIHAHIYKPPLEHPKPLNNEYLNREGVFCIQDCGILVRDFYHFEFGINLLIKPEWSLVEKKNWGQSIQTFLQFNQFQIRHDLKNMRYGDVFLIDLFGEKGNHGLIYIDENTILHQRDISLYEPLENFKPKFNCYYRHELC